MGLTCKFNILSVFAIYVIEFGNMLFVKADDVETGLALIQMNRLVLYNSEALVLQARPSLLVIT